MGKGTLSRPFQYMYDALKQLDELGWKMEDGKIGRIHEIWKEGKGVVVLQVFHHTSHREAHTREEAKNFGQKKKC